MSARFAGGAGRTGAGKSAAMLELANTVDQAGRVVFDSKHAAPDDWPELALNLTNHRPFRVRRVESRCHAGVDFVCPAGEAWCEHLVAIDRPRPPAGAHRRPPALWRAAFGFPGVHR